MTTPRLEINLQKIQHNARTLVQRLAPRGIAVTGVTKAALGSPQLAAAFLRAGVQGLGDSRIENLECLRQANCTAPLTLIRSPLRSQVDRVVAAADVSLNAEVDILRRLSAAAQKQRRTHGVILMVELGDLREGFMPDDLEAAARETLALPHLILQGVGSNLACRSGVCPDDHNMAELSAFATTIETKLNHPLRTVSGGNSANLAWALHHNTDPVTHAGRVNDLRLGESILLGRDPLHRQPFAGLFTDAITLVAEVLESKPKPQHPWGRLAQTAFGPSTTTNNNNNSPQRAPDLLHTRTQTLLALGHQDTDPAGLLPPPHVHILGTSSDHLTVDAGPTRLPPGTEIPFQLNYSALVRSMTSPFVTKRYRDHLRKISKPLDATHPQRDRLSAQHAIARNN